MQGAGRREQGAERRVRPALHVARRADACSLLPAPCSPDHRHHGALAVGLGEGEGDSSAADV